MKKKSASRSAFLSPRVLISFAFCTIGVLLVLFAFALYPGGNAVAAPKQHQEQSDAPALVQDATTVVDSRLTEDPTPTLGDYADTSVSLSGNTAIIPSAAPANTANINVSTSTNFKGTFAANPTTGVVTVTDAHPAGTYVVTVTALGVGVTTTKTFTLTVTSTPCGAGLTAGFTSAANVGVSVGPSSVAIGDFNGDGKQDLAVTNSGSNTVSIRLGDGLGGFSGSTEVSVGASPQSVAIGDFNGDGKQDLAVANSLFGGSGTVSIRLGDGVGGFSGSTEVSVGVTPQSVVIGDFNGDGKQDFAVVFGTSSLQGGIVIRLGDGLGGFGGSPFPIMAGGVSFSAAIGDFNGDGKQDLAVAHDSSGVSICLGNGSGGVTCSTEVSVGFSPRSVAIGDFNGDGKQDLAVANLDSGTVSIRLGNGLGGFSGSMNISVGNGPRSVAIGDFNGDGKQDLAVACEGINGSTTGTVAIRLGDGLGGFTDLTTISTSTRPQSVAIGDFNGDGKQDLAVAKSSFQQSGTVGILLGQCTPVPSPTPPPGGTPTPTPVPTPVNISGAISYCPNPVPGPVPNVMLSLTGSTSGSTLSNGSGNYQFSSLTPGSSYVVTPTKSALTPSSAGIDTMDAMAVQMHYLNIAALPPGCQLAAADVNGDTSINTNDAVAIQRFFIGRTFGIANVGQYKFTPVSRAYPDIDGNQTNQNYDALVFGDVASSFVHRPGRPSQATGNDLGFSTVAMVALPEIAADTSKNKLTAPVTTSAIAAKNKLVGFQGDFLFDERVITFQSEPVQKAGITAGNWNVSGNVLPGPGPIRTLRVSAYSNDFKPLSGSGTLFELRIRTISDSARRIPNSAFPLVWAAPPDNFSFIDADLKTQNPSEAVPGSVSPSGKRK